MPAPRSVDGAPRPTMSAAGAEDFYAAVYAELRRIAHHHIRGQGSAPTLSTTELVHEAFLKLRGRDGDGFNDRDHFLRTASRAMRHVLVDFARRRRAARRGAEPARVSVSDASVQLDLELDQILALDDALERLGALDDRLRQVVELRFFAGLEVREVAGILGVTARTVERDWIKARLFLLRELDEPP